MERHRTGIQLGRIPVRHRECGKAVIGRTGDELECAPIQPNMGRGTVPMPQVRNATERLQVRASKVVNPLIGRLLRSGLFILTNPRQASTMDIVSSLSLVHTIVTLSSEVFTCLLLETGETLICLGDGKLMLAARNE